MLPAHLTQPERDALEEFVHAVRARMESEIYELRLFGSRARGEGNEESDLDVAVIVTAEGRARRREVHDLAFDASLPRGVEVAPLVIEKTRLDELRRRERLIAADIDRDGIPL